MTEEELALALEEGGEGITPQGPVAAGSTNGLTEADSEYDPLNDSMEDSRWVDAACLGCLWTIQDEFM